jgi:hypothetical protein
MDNNMSEFFASITDYKKLAEWINKHSMVSAGVVGGAALSNNTEKHETGGHLNIKSMSKKLIKKFQTPSGPIEYVGMPKEEFDWMNHMFWSDPNNPKYKWFLQYSTNGNMRCNQIIYLVQVLYILSHGI